MKKEKIAISIATSTLAMVDAMVDRMTIRSRSQAIEYLISKGIEQQYIKDAVILMKGDDAAILLEQFEHKALLTHHLEWLSQHGIQDVFLITGESPALAHIEELCCNRQPRVRIIKETQPNGTIPALLLVRKELGKNFIMMHGDTLNQFDLTKMILFHLKHDKIATVGLISLAETKNFSVVDLEGDRIVEFHNEESASHIVDAGIYLFKPVIFKHLTQGKRRLERDVFSRLCHTDEIKGYFTFGAYRHWESRSLIQNGPKR